ncbi:MAG: hypothetical protein KC478_10575 [Bacteriovoracaceae bacterium]|nr:hypothetical protein [Bacteriovoracaceae bacterium]
MNYIFLFLFISSCASAQVVRFTYKQSGGQDQVKMTFSPEGFLINISSFEILYSKKSDKFLFVKDGKSYKLTAKPKTISMVKGDVNSEKECEEYLEKSESENITLLCFSKIDPLASKHINGRYSIFEYLQIYYQRLAGLTFKGPGEGYFLKLMHTIKRETQEITRTESLSAVDSLKVDKVLFAINKYKGNNGQCDSIWQCYQLATYN